ncbi:MAG: septum formation protein Maf [Eudoraea sp.]|nr:septum formation protein Maf [Eudoraea sp.]
MLEEKLKAYCIILASGSPRRKELLAEMGLSFELRLKTVEESYPDHLKGEQIPSYLAKKKAQLYQGELKANEILITADTVVWHIDSSLEKPGNREEAFEMLQALSGNWHEVITSVCICTKDSTQLVSDLTRVKFADLSPEEIAYYIDKYKPFDKAGAYGIQEWLGLVGIEEIAGSYTNVVGLPTQKLYKALIERLAQAE